MSCRFTTSSPDQQTGRGSGFGCGHEIVNAGQGPPRACPAHQRRTAQRPSTSGELREHVVAARGGPRDLLEHVPVFDDLALGRFGTPGTAARWCACCVRWRQPRSRVFSPFCQCSMMTWNRVLKTVDGLGIGVSVDAPQVIRPGRIQIGDIARLAAVTAVCSRHRPNSRQALCRTADLVPDGPNAPKLAAFGAYLIRQRVRLNHSCVFCSLARDKIHTNLRCARLYVYPLTLAANAPGVAAAGRARAGVLPAAQEAGEAGPASVSAVAPALTVPDGSPPALTVPDGSPPALIARDGWHPWLILRYGWPPELTHRGPRPPAPGPQR